jgi:hypothetical protein
MPKGKQNIDAAVDSILGAKPAAQEKKAPANKGAKPPANKGAKASADDLVGERPSKAKGKAAAPAAKVKAKPAAKAKGKTPTARGERGSGKFYFPMAEREKLAKVIKAKLRKPTTTAEFAGAHNVETWQVRLAAKVLMRAKEIKLVKDGSTLTMQPK